MLEIEKIPNELESELKGILILLNKPWMKKSKQAAYIRLKQQSVGQTTLNRVKKSFIALREEKK